MPAECGEKNFRHACCEEECTPHAFPNKAIKLRRLPIFFTFSALISRWLLFIAIVGNGGLSSGGVGGFAPNFEPFPSPSPSPCGLDARRPRLRIVLSRELSVRLSSLEVFLKFSISPSTVIPLVAKYSSGIPTNRTTPRSDGTPRASIIKFWIRAAFLLFVVA